MLKNLKGEPIQIAGSIAIIFPFVAHFLTALWVKLAILPDTSEVYNFAPTPDWWQQMGFNTQQWINAGFIPSLLCGIYGISIVVWGMRSNYGSTIAKGLWAFLTAPIISVFYVVATF